MPLEHHITNIDEGQRQVLLLALAQLSLDRPGFDAMLWELAQKWEPGIPREQSMYERLRTLNADRIPPMRGFFSATVAAEDPLGRELPTREEVQYMAERLLFFNCTSMLPWDRSTGPDVLPEVETLRRLRGMCDVPQR